MAVGPYTVQQLSQIQTWRGNTVLPNTSRVFSRAILNRLITDNESMLHPKQAEFGKERLCTEHIHHKVES